MAETYQGVGERIGGRTRKLSNIPYDMMEARKLRKSGQDRRSN